MMKQLPGIELDYRKSVVICYFLADQLFASAFDLLGTDKSRYLQ